MPLPSVMLRFIFQFPQSERVNCNPPRHRRCSMIPQLSVSTIGTSELHLEEIRTAGTPSGWGQTFSFSCRKTPYNPPKSPNPAKVGPGEPGSLDEVWKVRRARQLFFIQNGVMASMNLSRHMEVYIVSGRVLIVERSLDQFSGTHHECVQPG